MENQEWIVLTEEKTIVLKENIFKLLILYLALIFALKIVFYKEPLVNVVSITALLFYLFFLPGGLILIYLHRKFNLFERFFYLNIRIRDLMMINSLFYFDLTGNASAVVKIIYLITALTASRPSLFNFYSVFS